MNLTWSIALAAAGITGLWLAGSRRRAGWIVGLTTQILWIVFALATGQYGFILSALAYGFVYARNALRGRSRSVHVLLKADVTSYLAALSDARRRTQR